CLQSKSYPWTF
nr:immunoglobulin light chain junction region [Macaca mulatta]MOX84954.1 immunoglobulin light chain junction region [Macaca mulatta]MOX84990.1 immunoglobulin light chain junction region [Macaca mulatta]MOX85026.1 immunoglobulin light chain junction region [Macaca mulatta]MOX85101.1 immunoglobulin light chain junction region [Macaca mulatta]